MNSDTTHKSLRIALYITLFLLVIFSAIPTAFAQGSEPTDDEVNRIAKQLYCPVCESTPLDVCPTEACRQWRELIRQMLSEGKSEEEIKQYFVTQYGVRVLNDPPNKFASYVVPVAAFLLGAFFLYRGFQMWLKPVGTETDSADDETDSVSTIEEDEYIQKLEEEIKKRK